MNDIAITGFGIISALGRGAEPTLHALKNGISGVKPISILKTSLTQFPAGEVKATNQELAEILHVQEPISHLRNVLLGTIAVEDAIKMADLKDLSCAAFINGTTVGGMDVTEINVASEELNFNTHTCGSATDLITQQIGEFGLSTTGATACSSAANAIMLGARMIRAGMVDAAVVGGAECLTLFHFNGFNSLMILNEQLCKPFSDESNGINLGEGAAYLVLEKAEKAKARNIGILGYLTGWGNRCDAYHATASSPNGDGPYLAMTEALKQANLAPKEIDYINAHGTGTQSNDQSELSAITRIWGENPPPFNSTKPLTGHATSAAAALESVISLLCLNHNFIPGLEIGRGREIRNVMCNSFAFGGNDSVLIFSKSDPS